MQLHINIEHEEAMMSTKDEAYRYMENRCKGYNKTRFVIKLKDLFEFQISWKLQKLIKIYFHVS